jgi:hypothetical protein
MTLLSDCSGFEVKMQVALGDVQEEGEDVVNYSYCNLVLRTCEE